MKPKTIVIIVLFLAVAGAGVALAKSLIAMGVMKAEIAELQGRVEPFLADSVARAERDSLQAVELLVRMEREDSLRDQLSRERGRSRTLTRNHAALRVQIAQMTTQPESLPPHVLASLLNELGVAGQAAIDTLTLSLDTCDSALGACDSTKATLTAQRDSARADRDKATGLLTETSVKLDEVTAKAFPSFSADLFSFSAGDVIKTVGGFVLGYGACTVIGGPQATVIVQPPSAALVSVNVRFP